MKVAGQIGTNGHLVRKAVVEDEDIEYVNVWMTNAMEMIWKKSPATLKNVYLNHGAIGCRALYRAVLVSKFVRDYVMVNYVQLLINKRELVINSNVRPHFHYQCGVNGENGLRALLPVVRVYSHGKDLVDVDLVLKMMHLKLGDV